jgi:formate/nitrite transporter FocA (FNT family)
LFTENTLTPILPLLTRRDRATLLNVLRLWGIVLTSNVLGACLFGWVLGHTPLFDAAIRQTMTTIGLEALHGDFGDTLLRGIFAGWLIALMVWLLPAAEMARLWVIIILTYIVGLAGFSHIVAGSTEMFYLATTGAASWGDVIGGYLLPTLIGNILGGVALVAALNYAQVVSGKE